MSVTNYKPSYDLGCKYSYDKLDNVVYLVSKSHVKNVYIDNGEAYIDDLTEEPMRLDGFSISLDEDTSLDERYKFTKTVRFSLHGYVPHTQFEEKYYIILKSKDGTQWMVNVDFPSRVTYTFNLNGSQYQTDFTFSSLSNFPTLKLATEITDSDGTCVQYINTSGIKSLQLLENDYCSFDDNHDIVYTYGNNFKDVEFIGTSCSLQETFDGDNVTTTIEFNIAFDSYKSSWHYNLLEFLQNLYSSIIIPKGTNTAFLSGFNNGLIPSFKVAASTQNNGSDIITVTLVESSSKGSGMADNWSIVDDSTKNWVYIKSVGDIIAYECVGNGLAKYLLQQEVNKSGYPTGRYKALEGYESQFPNLNIVGTFSDEETFSNSECTSTRCQVDSNLPVTIKFDSLTCYTYTYSASCDWHIIGVPSFISISVLSGEGGTEYELEVCAIDEPSDEDVTNFLILAGDNPLIVNVVYDGGNNILIPSTANITCLAQNVTFIYDSLCLISVTSIDPTLTYTLTNSQLIVQVPKNNSAESGVTWHITVEDCNGDTQTVTINQDKVYERWIDTANYMCESGNSYVIQMNYTGTTATNINRIGGKFRKGALIQTDDPRCTSSETKWVFDGNYYCVDGDKYECEEEFVSYDGGTTWSKTGNTRLGDLVESASTFCEGDVEYKWVLTDQWQCYGGEVPIQVKFRAEYSDSSTYSAECDSSSELTIATTRAHSTSYTAMTSCTIGDCVTSINAEAFNNCRSLTSVTIPNTVTSFGTNAFYRCSALTSVDIPDSVTTIGITAFWDCTSLTSIIIPDSVTSIGNGAFMQCSSLQSITLPTGLTSISNGLFEHCTSLTSVTIPNTVASIGEYACWGCSNLTSVTCLATTPPTLGNYAFYSPSTYPIYVPSGSVNAYKTAWSDYASRIQAIP